MRRILRTMMVDRVAPNVYCMGFQDPTRFATILPTCPRPISVYHPLQGVYPMLRVNRGTINLIFDSAP
jgi:hypothetical protein